MKMMKEFFEKNGWWLLKFSLYAALAFIGGIVLWKIWGVVSALGFPSVNWGTVGAVAVAMCALALVAATLRYAFEMFFLAVAASIAVVSLYAGGLQVFLFTASSLTIILRTCLYTGIPANNYAERRFLGWRAPAWMLIKKGWGFWIPPFLGGSVMCFTLENQEMHDETEIATADKSRDETGTETVRGRELLCKLPWFLEFVINPDIHDDKGRVKFLGLNWETVQRGVLGFLDSKLSKLGGTLSIDDISNMLREIEDYLRGFLQCETPPHLLPDSGFDGDLLKWYRENPDKVKKAIANHTSSDFEKDYGFHIRFYRTRTPVYDEKTKEDIRQEYREEQRRKAARRVLETAKEAAGVDRDALNSAKMLHQVPNVKEVIVSMSGSGNSIPILNLGDALGVTGKPAAKSGKKGGKL